MYASIKGNGRMGYIIIIIMHDYSFCFMDLIFMCLLYFWTSCENHLPKFQLAQKPQ